MFQTAVLALDLSPAEAPLLDCIGDLRSWGVTRLVIVHVVRAGYGQEPGPRALTELQEWLAGRASAVRTDDLQVEVQVRAARAPGDEILVAVAEVKAQLLVIGSRSHNLVSRMFLGSVARDLVRKTQVPLLLEWLEPNGDSTALHCIDGCARTLRHVLLTTDLSKHAAAAQDAAVMLAGRAMQIDCLSVVTPQAKDATPAWPLMVRAALDDLATRLEASGSRCEVLVLEGDPHDTIARVAAERNCSLILVGKRGEHWLKSTVIGSTALRLCETAGRPVLLVPLAEG